MGRKIVHCVKVSEYRVFSGLYFLVFGLNTRFTELISVFSPNTEKYGPEKTPYALVD